LAILLLPVLFIIKFLPYYTKYSAAKKNFPRLPAAQTKKSSTAKDNPSTSQNQMEGAAYDII